MRRQRYARELLRYVAIYAINNKKWQPRPPRRPIVARTTTSDLGLFFPLKNFEKCANLDIILSYFKIIWVLFLDSRSLTQNQLIFLHYFDRIGQFIFGHLPKI